MLIYWRYDIYKESVAYDMQSVLFTKEQTLTEFIFSVSCHEKIC